MRHNMGSAERIIRLILGTVIALLSMFPLNVFGNGPIWFSSYSALALFVIGLLIDITAFVAFCPINALVHLNSCDACRIGETHAHKPV